MVAGFAQEPHLLLTKLCEVRHPQSPWCLAQIYLTRRKKAQYRSTRRAAGTAAVGSGRWLHTRTTQAADHHVRSAALAIARAERTNPPDAPEILGNLPPRQTKLSTRSHSGCMLPTTEDPGFADDRSGVLRDGVLRTQIEAENPARKTLIISQRFFATPPSRFHALADGIHTILPSSSPDPTADLLKNLPLELLQGVEGQKMTKVHHDAT
jgi:hypothetical protein